MRRTIGYVTAFLVRLLSRGRVSGTRFTMRTPSLFRVGPRGELSIGQDTHFESAARVAVHAPALVGDRVYFGKNLTLSVMSRVEIGSDALFGENVSIHTENHGPAGDRLSYTSKPISIGEGVWIGAGAVVLGGVTIGAGATIGANAVVTKDVPAGMTAVGVPARILTSTSDRLEA